MRLEVYWSGHCVHAAWFMSEAIRIGAHPSNDLVLEGDGISHCHAVIHRSPDGDGYMIIGESSVRLNGIPISRAKLRQGDRLAIGSYEVLVRSEQVLFETQPVVLLTKRKAV